MLPIHQTPFSTLLHSLNLAAPSLTADPLLDGQTPVNSTLLPAAISCKQAQPSGTCMSGSAISCAATAAAPGAGQGIDRTGFANPMEYASDTADATASSPASMPDSAHASDVDALSVQNNEAADATAGASPKTHHSPQLSETLESAESAGPVPSVSAVSAADLGSSLLLKSLTGFPEGAAPDPAVSMATPQSLQDGSTTLSPLEMLIAALDPQKSQPGHAAMTSSANSLGTAVQPGGLEKADGSFDALPNGFWNTNLSTPSADNNAGFSGLPWDAARRASDAALLNGYQFGQPADSSQSAGMPQPQAAGLMARKYSYPPGIKRQHADIDQLLTAADMYAGGQFVQTTVESPLPAKHARHDSMVECTMDTTAAAAAAAAAVVAAGNGMPYSTALSDTAKQATAMPLGPPGTQAQSLNPCFDQLNPGAGPGFSLDAGMSLMSGAPLSQVQLAQSLSMSAHPQQMPYAPQHTRSLSLSHVDHASNMMHPMPASLHMASPMAAAAAAAANGQHPAIGYFYDSLASNPGHGVDEFIPAPMPIPSIPGVTVSPKMKPRRMSVPDLTPTAEEKEIGSKAMPRRQKVRFGDDLYTPTWVRGSGQQKEGFCDTCSPGKWLQLKNSAFWYHKQFFHGISSVSGRPFIRPVQVRHYDADIIEGLCHQCQQWVPIANAKRRNSVLWFRHAHKCHVYHKPKNEGEFGEYPNVDPGSAMLDIQSPLADQQHQPSDSG